MKIKRFEDIIAWQKAQQLATDIYLTFKTSKDFAFKNQICKASVSISNNIAEGYERQSDADFSKFLYYSLGSCSEVKSMLYIAEKLSYIDALRTQKLLADCSEISKILRGLINSISVKKAEYKPTTNHKPTICRIH